MKRSLTMQLWWIGFQPPTGGVAPWGMFSKSPQRQQVGAWGVLPFPLFQTKEEADIAFTENGFDKSEYRVVPVSVTIAEEQP